MRKAVPITISALVAIGLATGLSHKLTRANTDAINPGGTQLNSLTLSELEREEDFKKQNYVWVGNATATVTNGQIKLTDADTQLHPSNHRIGEPISTRSNVTRADLVKMGLVGVYVPYRKGMPLPQKVNVDYLRTAPVESRPSNHVDPASYLDSAKPSSHRPQTVSVGTDSLEGWTWVTNVDGRSKSTWFRSPQYRLGPPQSSQHSSQKELEASGVIGVYVEREE